MLQILYYHQADVATLQADVPEDIMAVDSAMSMGGAAVSAHSATENIPVSPAIYIQCH
jgi:hypothetical protein